MSQLTPNQTELDILNAPFVDTPRGIYVHKSGTQFQTSAADLSAKAPELMKKVSLAKIIEQTETLLKAPQTLALILLPILIMLGGIIGLYPLGLVVTFGAFYIWAVYGAKFASSGTASLFKFLGQEWLIWIWNLLGFANFLNWWWQHRSETRQIGTWEGIIVLAVGFVLFKFGVLEKLMHTFLEKQRAKQYPKPVADFILLKLLGNEAKKQDTSLPE